MTRGASLSRVLPILSVRLARQGSTGQECRLARQSFPQTGQGCPSSQASGTMPATQSAGPTTRDQPANRIAAALTIRNESREQGWRCQFSGPPGCRQTPRPGGHEASIAQTLEAGGRQERIAVWMRR
jgi:hypothetical protein